MLLCYVTVLAIMSETNMGRYGETRLPNICRLQKMHDSSGKIFSACVKIDALFQLLLYYYFLTETMDWVGSGCH